MAAFADLLDLRTAVVEHVGRADIADVFPRLVALAEAAFSRRLRLRDQIATATLTFTGGAAPLPADFAEAIGLYDASGAEYVAQPLQQVKTSGSSAFYAITGAQIVTYSGAGDRTLEYYATIPTLTDGGMTDTNWLLARYPGIYLYGVALEAAKYIKDIDLVQATAQLLAMAYAEAEADDARARYSRARVRLPGVVP